jgi:hypothetical protein
MPVVSKRALRGVGSLLRLSFQRFQSSGHHLRPQIEVRTVPGRNAGAQDDGLRRGVHDTDSLGDIAGQGAGVDHVDEIDRHISVQMVERAHLLVGNAAGGADGTVLLDDGERRGQGRGDIGLGGDLAHSHNVAGSCPAIYVRRIRSSRRWKRGSDRSGSRIGSILKYASQPRRSW